MSSSPPQNADLLQHYSPVSGVHDEFLTTDRVTRNHSRAFVDAINTFGPEEFGRRWEQAQRLVHENGFAYSGFTSKAKARPWELDAIPLLISAQEWQGVSLALQQRAQLLNLVLQDLYGSQTLLREGLLPPELVFSHPGFLRALHGQPPPADVYLHFYAADLARAPDGTWWVLADRTEAPSGLGYVLENRIVISRMLPDVFQECRVQRLAPFFIAAQQALRALAPQHRENPRVVLLSHGPTSPNYFEDAYLARYLGYTLVEGGDLAVRNSQVMLKTLGGLLPVDVILRRQNSIDCDPLELGSTSGFGIAGLTQAARTGQVGIANALGSGLVESPAFMAFMPQLCRSLLGSELLMPGVATWWCGDRESLNYVLSHLDEVIVQPAFRRRGHDGPRHESLGSMPEEELAATIRANPGEFAAQQKVQRSCIPVWKKGFQPAHLALRAYVVSSGGESTVMQGALARTSSSLDPLEMSLRRGEGSKDAWVLSEGPVEHVSLLTGSGQTIQLRRSGAELPSRSVDNIFWLGRQLERAEASARLLRSVASRLTGETRSTSTIEVPVLLRCLADQGQIEPGYALDSMRDQLPAIELVLPQSVFDGANSASLQSVLAQLFRLGSLVRDRISHDTWRVIRRIDEGFQRFQRTRVNSTDLLSMTDELIIGLVAFSGIVTESMTRTQVFRFLELGRRLERSLQTISLVKNCFVPLTDVHGPVLETVLEVADSLMTYRSRYMANLQLAAVLDLLLTDETNPRSVAYQFAQLETHVENLPRKRTQPGYTLEQKLAMSLLHAIRLVDIQLIAESHSLGEYEPLTHLIERWEAHLPKLSEAISHRYLVHAGPARQLTDIRPQ